MSLFQGCPNLRDVLFQGCPYFKGVLISGMSIYFKGVSISRVSLFQGCPYFRGILIARGGDLTDGSAVYILTLPANRRGALWGPKQLQFGVDSHTNTLGYQGEREERGRGEEGRSGGEVWKE